MGVYSVKKESLSTIADAIREKTGGTAALTLDGMAAAIPEVYAAGENAGYKVGYDDGFSSGEATGSASGYENGVADQYNGFWDSFQQNGSRTNYWYGFSGSGWKKDTLKPKYPVLTEDEVLNSQYAVGMFYRANAGAQKIEDYIDFSLIADKFDFSKVQRATDLFNSAKMQNVIADLSSAVFANRAFCNTWNPGITSLKLKVSEALQDVGNMFDNQNLAQIEMMEGSVWAVSVSFVRCTKLDKASISSITNALSDAASGSTVTLSLNAVNTAFETSEGAADGSDSEEWLSRIATKPNWTFSLA